MNLSIMKNMTQSDNYIITKNIIGKQYFIFKLLLV